MWRRRCTRLFICTAWPLITIVAAVIAWTGEQSRFFEDVAETAGLSFQHFIGATGDYFLPEILGSGVALLDYDGDGDLDVFVLQGTILNRTKSLKDAIFPPPAKNFPGNRLFRNDQNPKGALSFTDVTEEAGLADTAGYGMGAAVGDYDNDGYPDLFVTNVGGDKLFHNNGNGTFSDLTRAALPTNSSFGSSAAFVDYDNDGFLDLFVVRYNAFAVSGNKKCFGYAGGREYCGPGEYPSIPDTLYHNDKRGHFRDVTQAAGIGKGSGNGLGVVCADLNNDGLIDIFVANDKTPNHLWINRGSGRFEDNALLSGTAYDDEGKAHAGMGVTAADIDGDGDLDVFVIKVNILNRKKSL
jgi:enediyne biosynthesis protein E4